MKKAPNKGRLINGVEEDFGLWDGEFSECGFCTAWTGQIIQECFSDGWSIDCVGVQDQRVCLYLSLVR